MQIGRKQEAAHSPIPSEVAIQASHVWLVTTAGPLAGSPEKVHQCFLNDPPSPPQIW